jgi:hypothetical protein
MNLINGTDILCGKMSFAFDSSMLNHIIISFKQDLKPAQVIVFRVYTFHYPAFLWGLANLII